MTQEISSVEDRRSKITTFMRGDSFSHGRSALVTHMEGDVVGIWPHE